MTRGLDLSFCKEKRPELKLLVATLKRGLRIQAVNPSPFPEGKLVKIANRSVQLHCVLQGDFVC